MGLMFTTVIGYAVLLGISSLFLMHYLGKVFVSADSSKIDPKPDTKF
jgi:hypothetical protein